MAAPDRITITHQTPMTAPAIRAALERLIELDKTSITMRSKASSLAWADAVTTGRAALKADKAYRDLNETLKTERPELTDVDLWELLPMQFKDNLLEMLRMASLNLPSHCTAGKLLLLLTPNLLAGIRAAITADRELLNTPTKEQP